MMLSLDLYNCGHNALALQNHNKLAVHNPFLVPFRPILGCVPGTYHMQLPWLDPDLAPQFVFYRQVLGPSTFDSYDNLFLHDPQIYKSCKRATGGSGYILAIDGSY